MASNTKDIIISENNAPARLTTSTAGVPISISQIPPDTGKLKDYPVYYIDDAENSKFFDISQFPTKLTSGKTFFLITGTDLLVPTTAVLIEVLDVNGNELPIKIPNILLNGTDRIVSIEVKSTDYYGKGLVTILGQAQDVPKEWKGAYNVKWQKEVIINPSLYNTGEVIFEVDPTLFFTEDYDDSQLTSNEIFIEKNYKQGVMYSKIGKSPLVPAQYTYMLYLQDGPLASENSLFDGLSGWDTSSTYISDVTSSDNKLYFSQSYGMFGITEGVTQDVSMSADVIYTLHAEFKGSESQLGSSVASMALYSGSNLYAYLYTTASIDVTMSIEISSSVDTIATLELSGQAFALSTVWSNVYLGNLISGSEGNGFSTGMEGGKLTVSASDMTFPVTGLFESSGSYTTWIYKVINPQTAIANNSYEGYNLNIKNNQRTTFLSASYNINYNKTEYITRPNLQNSYLNIFFKDLKTLVGNLKNVDVYKNPGNVYVGRYDVKSYNILTEGNTFTELGDFTGSWTDGGSGSYLNLTGGGGSRTKTPAEQAEDE